MPSVTWEAKSIRKLRAAYNKAVKDGVGQFTLQLDGEPPLEFIVDYAKYLLEFLEGRIRSAK